MGAAPVINTWQVHHGEEPVISGSRGSGTIFFSGCNLACVFCQNHRISQQGWGSVYSVEQTANIMLDLQAMGVHNINLVTPGHFALPLRDALIMAKERGLQLPVVWNTNAYELPEVLRELRGLVDIYLPDFKYSDPAMAARYSAVGDYPQVAQDAILEMFNQVGLPDIDDEGLARRGVFVRLLVLPGDVNGLSRVLEWLRQNLGRHVFISLMSQYYPTHRAGDFTEINRPLTRTEYETAVSLLDEYGFINGFVQEMGITPEWTPDFKEKQ